MSPIPFFARHPRADLSAYIDEQLSKERAAVVETHLARCASCRTDVEGLRETRAALGALPQATAPRSFALTPQHLAAPARPAPRRTEPIAPAFFGLRIASAGIAVALALVFVAGLGGGSSNDSSQDNTAALEALTTNAGQSSNYAAPEAGGSDDSLGASATFQSELDAEKDELPTPTLPAGSAPAATNAASGANSVGSAGIGVPNTGSGGSVGSAPTGETTPTPALAGVPSTDIQVNIATESPPPPEAVGAVPGTTAGPGNNREGAAPTSELAANPVADSAPTGDNDNGLSALQIAEIVLTATLAVAVTGGFLLPLALRRLR